MRANTTIQKMTEAAKGWEFWWWWWWWCSFVRQTNRQTDRQRLAWQTPTQTQQKDQILHFPKRDEGKTEIRSLATEQNSCETNNPKMKKGKWLPWLLRTSMLCMRSYNIAHRVVVVAAVAACWLMVVERTNERTNEGLLSPLLQLEHWWGGKSSSSSKRGWRWLAGATPDRELDS